MRARVCFITLLPALSASAFLNCAQPDNQAPAESSTTSGSETGSGDESSETEESEESGEESSETEQSETSGDTTGAQDMPCQPGQAEECPEGTKCSPYARDPSLGVIDAAHCVPVTGDAAVGESCRRDFETGADDCAPGLFCFADFYDQLGLGKCRALCDRSREDACGGGDDLRCIEHFAGYLPLCMPRCHPLLDNCGDVELCEHYMPRGDGRDAVCVPITGPQAARGEACEPLRNWCAAGLHCTPAEQQGECAQGDSHCCATFCDRLDANACEDGQFCQCVYGTGFASCRMGVCVLDRR